MSEETRYWERIGMRVTKAMALNFAEKMNLEATFLDEEVEEFFVSRYGPSVLLKPPREGFNLLAWILPPLGLLILLITSLIVLGKMRNTYILISNKIIMALTFMIVVYILKQQQMIKL